MCVSILQTLPSLHHLLTHFLLSLAFRGQSSGLRSWLATSLHALFSWGPKCGPSIVSFIQYIDHIHPCYLQLLPMPLPLSPCERHVHFVVVDKPIEFSYCCPYVPECVAILWCMSSLPAVTSSKDNFPSLSSRPVSVALLIGNLSPSVLEF